MSTDSLTRFGQHVANAVAAFKIDGHKGVDKVEHEYRPVKNLEYRFEDSLYYLPDRENYKRYFRYEWQSSALTGFFEEKIKGIESYEQALNHIYEITYPYRAIEDPVAFKQHIERYALHQFAYFLCKKTIQDDFDPASDLKYYSEVFENDLTKDGQITFYATMYMDGLNIEGEELHFTPTLSIRKLTADDLATTTRDFYESGLEKMTGRTTEVLTAFEAKIEAPIGRSENIVDEARKQLKQILENSLNTIRFLAVTNSHETHISFRVKSILYYTFDDPIQSPFSNYLEKGFLPRDGAAYIYTLRQSDVPNFVKLFLALSPTLSGINSQSYFEGQAHELAYHRYRDSLLRSKLNINRLSYAIYALDAGFVRDTEGKQPKDKLLTRSARLVEWSTGGNMQEIRSQLEEAYGIRNKLVHGGRLTDQQRQFSEQYTKVVLNHVRIAIAVMLQLHPCVDKDSLINKIELAQKNVAILNQLKHELSQLVLPI